MTRRRNRLRSTFDGAALLYDEVRPGYPEDLFDDVVALSRIPAGGRILEIGCGTGQATVPFARRGYRILCVELGENMAAVARRNLEGYAQAEVRCGDFEKWPLGEGSFDLAISATAFHWLDPQVAYPKGAGARGEGGARAGRVRARRYQWDETYDAEGYLRVLNTYSGHRSLGDATRRRLFSSIADLIDGRYGGRVVKGYLRTLYVAH